MRTQSLNSMHFSTHSMITVRYCRRFQDVKNVKLSFSNRTYSGSLVFRTKIADKHTQTNTLTESMHTHLWTY